jgi:hypothetical protein
MVGVIKIKRDTLRGRVHALHGTVSSNIKREGIAKVSHDIFQNLYDFLIYTNIFLVDININMCIEKIIANKCINMFFKQEI